MDRFDAMRAFVQVLESGSYTQAARQLNLHKATVSQQIQQLEERLGTRLLTRTTRSVAPTAEGTAYYAHACSILQQVDEAETLLREGASAAAGHLRVNVPVAMGRWCLRRRSATSCSATRGSRSSWDAPIARSTW
jgi:LysR family transcriptional regulator for bpeEF and oprC